MRDETLYCWGIYTLMPYLPPLIRLCLLFVPSLSWQITAVQTLETHYTTRAAVWLGLQLVDAGGSACLLLLWMGLYFPSVPNSAVMKEMRSEGHRGKDTPLLCHLYIKCIILPRQARDKHRESTQKRVAFP
jgi:hypothetical protein